jgi:hypothetical protein
MNDYSTRVQQAHQLAQLSGLKQPYPQVRSEALFLLDMFGLDQPDDWARLNGTGPFILLTKHPRLAPKVLRCCRMPDWQWKQLLGRHPQLINHCPSNIQLAEGIREKLQEMYNNNYIRKASQDCRKQTEEKPPGKEPHEKPTGENP